MPILIHPATLDVALETSFCYHWQHAELVGVGYCTNIKKSTNVRATEAVFEGAAYRCWRAAAVADAVSGSFRTSGGNRYYYSLSVDGRWADWNIGTLAVPANALEVSVVGVVAGSIMEVVKNPATDNRVIGTLTTVTGATNYYLTRIVTLSETVTTGDVLRFRRQAGETGSCSICSWLAYHTADLAVSTDQQWFIAAPVQVAPNSSTCDCAYSVQPIGGARKKWAGGYYHNQPGVDNCSEINVVEQWACNGAVWTPVVGWAAGEFQLHRQSDVDYDDGAIHRVIATLETYYEFAYRSCSVASRFVCGETLEIAGIYPAMCTVSSMFTKCVTNAWDVVDIVPTDAALIEAADPTAVTDFWFLVSPLGAARHIHLDYASITPLYKAIVWRQADATKKAYFQILPTSLTVGSSWGGKWTTEYTNRKPRQGMSQITLAPQRKMPATSAGNALQAVEATSPALWVSADRGVFVADAAGVADIVSREGKLKHFVQATAGNRPTLDVDGLGGKPALVFVATSVQYVQCVEDLLSGQTGYGFIVASVTANTDYKVFLSVGDSADIQNMLALRSSSAEKIGLGAQWNTASYNDIYGATVKTALALYEIGSNGTGYIFTLNGVPEAITVGVGENNGNWAGDLTARTHVCLGARSRLTVDAAHNGMIAEWIVYDSLPSAATIALVRNYLMAKYGIA